MLSFHIFIAAEVNDSSVGQTHALHGGPQQINLCGASVIAMVRALIGQSSIVRSAEKISLQVSNRYFFHVSCIINQPCFSQLLSEYGNDGCPNFTCVTYMIKLVAI